MPLPEIDFRRIRGYGVLGSAADAFEELATELLEEELVSWPEGTRFERFGNPDGGREGRGLLPDGAVWAWQAKFLFAMDAGELGQIGKSIVRALEREPQLTRYFVLMPYDLPAGDTAKASSAHTKWEEHVGTWTALAADKEMSVEFEYIGAHQLTKALTRPSQAGRLRYWFDIHAFDKPWFAGIAERAAVAAGPRYMPELHVGLPIAEIFASLGQTAEFELSLRDRLASLRSVGRFAWESPEEHRAVLTPLIEDVQPALIELDAALVSIIRGVGAGPEAVPGIGERLSLVRNLLEPLDEKFTELSPPEGGYYVGAAGSLYSSIRQVWRLLGDLRELSSGAIWQSAQRRLVVLTGEAGTGKTHLLCDVAKARTAAGLPTIILLGQHFDTRAPLVQMSELLHFGGAPDELLPTLNAAAQAAGRRGLVIIDALNEAGQPEMWQEHLAKLVHDVLQQPWLALAISCRTPYLDVVVPAAVREQGALVEHYGFEEATPEAVGRYLEFFGLETPSFPLLNPELANPLFLRLLCEALHSRGERRFPRKGVGLLWLYEAYLQAVNKRLSRPGRCDYDAQSRLAGQAVRKLAETQEDKGRAPTREEAAEIAETLLPGRRWSASLLKGLLDEGVVSTTHLAGTEYVQFGYQRLGDVATASLICDQPVEAAAAACRQLASQWGRHAGVLEALAAILPETHGLDLVEVAGDALDGYARSQLSQAMLTGLSFRGASSITARTFEWLNGLAAANQRGWRDVFTTCLGLSTVPDHPLNAEWLHHQQLLTMSLVDRDLSWTRLCSGAFGQVRAPGELVSWAWSPAARATGDDVCRLAATTLAWMLTSTNRPLRDRATKALVHLLDGRPTIFAELIASFDGVDDPYVWERLLAVGCGLCLRSKVAGDRVLIGSVVAEHTILAKRWPDHLLARDYARRAIESGLESGWDAPPGVAGDVCPPYGLVWPMVTRTEHEIEAMSGPPDYPYGSVSGSVIGEFGDFNKYVISPALADVALPEEYGVDVVARRVFDRVLELGWTPERFAQVDKGLHWEPNQGQVTERLGKKYQWIALHETLARVVDSYPVDGQYSDEREHPYDNPADLDARDIDPTSILRTSEHAGFDGVSPVWFAPVTVPFAELPQNRWLTSADGLPDPGELLVVRDSSAMAWSAMEGYYRWTEPLFPDEEIQTPSRRLWYQVRSYVFEAVDSPALEEWAREQHFYGRWMPEAAENRGVLLADYPQHPSWRFTPGGDGRWRRRNPPPTDLTPTSAWYMGTGTSYDCSTADAMHGLLPSAKLYPLLKATQRDEFRLTDPPGLVVAEDFAVRTEGPASLHVLADRLVDACSASGMSILWTVVGEKQINGPDSNFRDGELLAVDVEAVYVLDGNAARLVTNSASLEFVGAKQGETVLWTLPSAH